MISSISFWLIRLACCTARMMSRINERIRSLSIFFHATTPTLLIDLLTSATFDKTFKQNQHQPDTGCYFDGKRNIQQLKNQPDDTDRGNPRGKICSHQNQNDSKKRTKCFEKFIPCVYVNHLLFNRPQREHELAQP